jgi:integrase
MISKQRCGGNLRHGLSLSILASFLVNAGRTLYEVQHILGHSQVATTQRYAHLSPDTRLAATNSVHKALGNMFLPRLSPATLIQEPIDVVSGLPKE